MIFESGENWYANSGLSAPTISVIDRPEESYDEYHERKVREQGARRVRFGFARVLDEEAVASLPEYTGERRFAA